MNDFLNDYATGRTHGRYVDAELPDLPFDDSSFDIALCSHFLFLYTTQPLLALGAVPSSLVEPVTAEFGQDGFDVSIEDVLYEFQRGGNRMMRIRRYTGA